MLVAFQNYRLLERHAVYYLAVVYVWRPYLERRVYEEARSWRFSEPSDMDMGPVGLVTKYNCSGESQLQYSSQSLSHNITQNNKMINEEITGKDVERSGHSLIKILHHLRFEGLRKTAIVCVPAEIRTENLTNTSRKRCRFTQFVR
jgi:hypothetical protein